MTSNLGTTAGADRSAGLRPARRSEQTYVKAAEEFFRPEFFNRIDRIIPFEPQSARKCDGSPTCSWPTCSTRDGLVRRRCAVGRTRRDGADRRCRLSPAVRRRALKRVIERQLVQPVAASLAGVKPEVPAVIDVLPQPQGIATYASPLESVPTVQRLAPGNSLLTKNWRLPAAFVARRSGNRSGRPHDSAASGIGPAQIYFYAVKEQLLRVRQLTDSLAESLVAIHSVSHLPLSGPKAPHQVKKGTREHRGEHRFVREIHAAEDIHAYLHEAASLRLGRKNCKTSAIGYETKPLYSNR